MRARHSIWMLVLGASACGGGEASLTPLEACQRQAEISCSKAYECLEEPELELLAFPASPDACLAELTAACDGEPEAEFCADGETYHPESAAACMEKAGSASCEQIFGSAEEAYAPACAEMCRPPA